MVPAFALASYNAGAENQPDAVHVYAIPAGTLNEALTEFLSGLACLSAVVYYRSDSPAAKTTG